MRNKKIKIMFFIINLNRGGAETLLLTICKWLVQHSDKYEFKVVLFEKKLHLAPEFERLGIEVICLQVMNESRFTKISKSYSIIRQYKPDIVHTHLLLTDRYGLIAAFLAGIKKRICTVHSMEEKRGGRDKITRLLSSVLATEIIMVSKSAKRFCVKNRLYPERKMSVIYNAPSFKYEHAEPKRLENNKGVIKLLNVARLSESKGQIYLMQALRVLNKYTCKLEMNIYGHGYLKPFLEEEIDRHSIKNVFLRGLTFNIIEVYKNADIFIAPSLWEGFNMALVEAMSMGIPVIATDIPTHREIFQDTEEYPLFVKREDPQAIVEAIKKLLESPELYIELSEKCLLQAKRYSIDSMIANYDTFYNRLKY